MTKIFSNMTHEEKKAYKLELYHKNKERYNIAKIANAVEKGGRKPRFDTIEKYKFKINDDNEVIIPKKYKFVIKHTDELEKPPPPVINVVVQTDRSDMTPYDLDNNHFNGKEFKNWVATILPKMPKNIDGDDFRGDREIKEYNKIPDLLFEFNKLKYNENTDLTPFVMDATKLITQIDNKQTWKAYGTKSKFLGRILFISKHYPPLKHRFNKDLYTILDSQYIKWEGLAKSAQRKKTKETSIFSWNVIKDQVLKKYGKLSYESLLIQLYDAMIGRDDFQLNMAYKPSDMIAKKQNYLLLERNKVYSAVYMNTYKTVGKYGKLIYKLPKSLTELIMTLHKDDTQKYLFPREQNKLSSWLIDLLRSIDLFKDEQGLGVKYLRHSLVSTKLMEINPKDPNYNEKVLDLAEKAMHNVARQETYTSPLKDASGKLIKKSNDETSLHLFDAIVQEWDEMPVDEPSFDKSLIGLKVVKMFKDPKTKKKRNYIGDVVAFDDGYYKVVYEDGDIDDMDEDEVKKHLVKK